MYICNADKLLLDFMAEIMSTLVSSKKSVWHD